MYVSLVNSQLSTLMEGKSRACNAKRKITKGHFSFIFGMNYTFLTFLIVFFLWLVINEFVFPELTLLIVENHA